MLSPNGIPCMGALSFRYRDRGSMARSNNKGQEYSLKVINSVCVYNVALANF